MWECLAGRPPFCGSSVDVMAAHLHQAMPPLPGWVPGPLCDLVARLTAKDPGTGYPMPGCWPRVCGAWSWWA